MEFVRIKARLEGMVDSNQKTFNEFGSMLDHNKQVQAREILVRANKALESGNSVLCSEALEKIAEVGKILSEVILYDPGSFSAESEEGAGVEEEA